MRGLLLCGLLAGLLAGCAQAPEQSALGTHVPLKPAPQLAGAAVPGARVWLAPDAAQYVPSSFYIPPVKVDHGPSAEFEDVDPTQVAAVLTQDVRKAMGQKYRVVGTPEHGSHTIQLVLVRVVPPEAVHITNGPYPWAGAVVGMPNRVYSEGEMLVGGKFEVSATGKLLAAFVAPVSPSDMMMGPATSPQASQQFVQDVSRTFATSLVASIERQMQLNKQAR